MNLYYECHVTIEPIFDNDLSIASNIAYNNKFKIANLLMQKRKEDTPQRSRYDTFMTGHDKDYRALEAKMISLIKELQTNGFKVWRYKIESILLDSKKNDFLSLLSNN